MGARRTLGGDQLTIGCHLVAGQPWLYYLTGKQDGIQPYLDQRLDDTRTRIATMRAVSAVVADATDGRTREARRPGGSCST